MAKHAVIYVFGLSDHRGRSQELAVKLWRFYGVTPSVFHMYWSGPGDFNNKLAELLKQIDALSNEGYRVSLVGTSAGASVVVNAYAARQNKVHRVVCICGKLRHAETVSPSTYRRNPAFKASLELLPSSLLALSEEKRARILSIRPLADETVPLADTFIDSARNKQVPTVGHALTIGFCVALYAPAILRFLTRD